MTTQKWKAHAHPHEGATGHFVCNDEGPLAEGIEDLEEAQAIADKLNELEANVEKWRNWNEGNYGLISIQDMNIRKLEQDLKNAVTEKNHLEAALKESCENHVAKREAWNTEFLALREEKAALHEEWFRKHAQMESDLRAIIDKQAAYIQVLEHAADKADVFVCDQGTAKEDASWTEFCNALAELWKFQKGQA